MKDTIMTIVINNLSILIAAVFGAIVPGALTVAIYKLNYYVELGILQLLFLAFVISALSLWYIFILLLLTFFNDVKDGLYASLVGASISNLMIFVVALLLKIFIPSMTKKGLVGIILLECIAFTVLEVVLFTIDQKDNK